eukprot:TRINITY_DN3090_c0_g1_i1.p1 TRINITY_DN3090_c0_g1~~TRINITY_DN3090_c0_g1_i1.p1  ORF type:complete len:705 (-),score=241.46 TRINITY_DN3090_c0_g1_i1:78-2192(-)
MQGKTLLFCVGFLLAITTVVYAAPVNTGLSSTFTEEDVADTISLITSATKDKSWPTNIQEAYFASHTLRLLGSSSLPKQKEQCNLAKSTLTDKKTLDSLDIISIYYAVLVADELKCDIKIDRQPLIDSLRKSTEKNSFNHIYYSTATILALHNSNIVQIKGEFKDSEISGLISKLHGLVEEDGSVLATPNAKEGSLYNTGLLLQLLSKPTTAAVFTAADQKKLESLYDQIDSMVDAGSEDGNQLQFSADDDRHSNLQTTASLIRGIADVAGVVQKKKKIGIRANQISQIGEYLLANKKSTTVQDAYFLISGLRAVQSNPISSPLSLTIVKSSILSSAKGDEGNVVVRVTDVFDKPVSPVQVYLTKANQVGKTEAIIAKQEAVSQGSSHTINFIGAKPDQGFYNLELRATPQGEQTNKYPTVETKRKIKVIGPVVVSDLELVVSDQKDKADGSKYKSTYPNKIEEPIPINNGQFVHFTFRVRGDTATGRPLIVQQSFIRFTNTQTGQEQVFVATPNDTKFYTAVINVDEVSRVFKHQSGEYRVDVIVGDAFIQNPVLWTIAPSVQMKFAAPPVTKNTPAPISFSSVLPEIKFKFPEQVNRDRLKFFSNVYSLVVLAPFPLFLIGLGFVGANIKRFPFSGLDFIYAVGFLASIGGLLGSLVAFWIYMTLTQAIGYLSILAIPTCVFGQRALSRLAGRGKEKHLKEE